MSNSFALSEVSVALSPQERFEEYLQSKGKRITQSRRVIVDEIFSRHEHFDADELLLRLQNNDSSVDASRPTVYRALKELVEAGLLRKMSLNGRAVYEHDYGYPQHDHLHCERCGKLIEFSSDKLKPIIEAAAAEHGFRVVAHRLIVSGVCKECQGPRRRAARKLDLV